VDDQVYLQLFAFGGRVSASDIGQLITARKISPCLLKAMLSNMDPRKSVLHLRHTPEDEMESVQLEILILTRTPLDQMVALIRHGVFVPEVINFHRLFQIYRGKRVNGVFTYGIPADLISFMLTMLSFLGPGLLGYSGLTQSYTIVHKLKREDQNRVREKMTSTPSLKVQSRLVVRKTLAEENFKKKRPENMNALIDRLDIPVELNDFLKLTELTQ